MTDKPRKSEIHKALSFGEGWVRPSCINEEKQPGVYEVEFSAKGGSASGGNGSILPSGIYFYQLKSGSFTPTKKMIVVK